MKTRVNDYNLQVAFRQSGIGYDLGVLALSAVSGMEKDGFSVKKDELMGRFDGIQTYMDFVESHNSDNNSFGNNRYGEVHDTSSHSKRGGSWTKFNTWDKGLYAMKKTPEVFRNFSESDLRLNDEENAGNDFEYGVSGDFLDIDRVLSGEPEAFGVMKDGTIISRFCQITIVGNHYSMTTQSEIDEVAQGVLRLVDMLEQNNVRCEIGMVWSNDNSHLEILLKHYNDRLDINDIAVALSADFFRRLDLWWSEHSSTLDYGYGRAEMIAPTAFYDEDADATIVVGNGLKKIGQAFKSMEKMIEENSIRGHRLYTILNGDYDYKGEAHEVDIKNGSYIKTVKAEV